MGHGTSNSQRVFIYVVWVFFLSHIREMLVISGHATIDKLSDLPYSYDLSRTHESGRLREARVAFDSLGRGHFAGHSHRSLYVDFGGYPPSLTHLPLSCCHGGTSAAMAAMEIRALVLRRDKSDWDVG